MVDKKLHFLVVNDSPHIQHVIVSLLKEIGFLRMSEASNGEMALRAIKLAISVGNPIKFIITDCAMPFMDGIELIRAIRNESEMFNVPILMVTEHASVQSVLSAHEAGADAFIVRPFSANSFRNKVESLLVSKGLKESTVSMKSFRPFLRSHSDRA